VTRRQVLREDRQTPRLLVTATVAIAPAMPLRADATSVEVSTRQHPRPLPRHFAVATTAARAREPSVVRHAQTVGERRSPGAALPAHPWGSARVGSRCGQPWWSAPALATNRHKLRIAAGYGPACVPKGALPAAFVPRPTNDAICHPP
jgi:hypothetical protein